MVENLFKVQEIAVFNTPWAIAFLPDQRRLATEKAGHIFLTDQKGKKTGAANVPPVSFEGQKGLLDIAVYRIFPLTSWSILPMRSLNVAARMCLVRLLWHGQN